MHNLQDNIVIMTTSMIASIILMSRKGIIEPILISKVDWLIKEIIKRGSKKFALYKILQGMES